MDAVAEGEVDPELADLPELMDSASEESDDKESDNEEFDDGQKEFSENYSDINEIFSLNRNETNVLGKLLI